MFTALRIYMISFDLRLRNPWHTKPFRNIACWTWQLNQHNSFELQFSRYAFNWFEVQVDLNWRQTDHAGPWITINVFGWTVDARIYDHRHWNDQTNNWDNHATY